MPEYVVLLNLVEIIFMETPKWTEINRKLSYDILVQIRFKCWTGTLVLHILVLYILSRAKTKNSKSNNWSEVKQIYGKSLLTFLTIWCFNIIKRPNENYSAELVRAFRAFAKKNTYLCIEMIFLCQLINRGGTNYRNSSSWNYKST